MAKLENLVLKSARYVVERSKDVKIARDKVKEFSKTFRHGELAHWLSAAPVDFPALNEEQKLYLLFLYSTESFCYWGDPQWTVEHNGKNYTGSWAMIYSLAKALKTEKRMLDADYRATVSEEKMKEMLRGNVEIPLFAKRLEFMRESGRVLSEKYGGKLENLIEAAGGDALKLLEILTANFSAFDDTAEYDGKKIYFYKKAQLFISDLYQLFGGEGYGALRNISKITTLADYRLPQVMRKLGLLKYSDELARKIDNKEIIPRDSREEIELRANTIWVVELMYRELKKQNPAILTIGINDHFWLLRREKFTDDQVHHRTITTAY